MWLAIFVGALFYGLTLKDWMGKPRRVPVVEASEAVEEAVPEVVAEKPEPVPAEVWDRAVVAYADAANGSMQRHGREEWAYDDWQAGLGAFVEAVQVGSGVRLSRRQQRTFSEKARREWSALHGAAVPGRGVPAPPA